MLIKLHDACSTIYGFRFNLPAEIFIKRNSSYKTKIIKSILNSRNACFCWVKNLFVFLYSAWKNLRLNIRTLHLAVTLCGFRTRCLIPRKHLKLRCRKWQEAGENGITGGFTICMISQFLWWSNQLIMFASLDGFGRHWLLEIST